MGAGVDGVEETLKSFATIRPTPVTRVPIAADNEVQLIVGEVCITNCEIAAPIATTPARDVFQLVKRKVQFIVI